jgi:hypothetical protein
MAGKGAGAVFVTTTFGALGNEVDTMAAFVGKVVTMVLALSEDAGFVCTPGSRIFCRQWQRDA